MKLFTRPFFLKLLASIIFFLGALYYSKYSTYSNRNFMFGFTLGCSCVYFIEAASLFSEYMRSKYPNSLFWRLF